MMSVHGRRVDLQDRVYVSGGMQKARNTEEWRQFEKGLILRVDLATGSVDEMAAYRSSPEVCPDVDASVSFKASALADGRLYTCTNTEVVVYELPAFRVAERISNRCFNDLHYVCPTEHGTLMVVVTGLDLIVEVDHSGEVLREWPTIEDDPWKRFSRDIDYRKAPTTKPHTSHPNYVTQVGGQWWASRFVQKDAICLTEPARRVEFCGAPHDGVCHNGRVYYTTVNGFVYVLDQKSMRIEAAIDLNAMDERDMDLGWARGILPVNDDLCWVGFTQFRPTKLRENLSWIRHGLRQYYLPTRLALYDFSKRQLCREITLNQHGMHALFAILREPAQ